MGEDDRLIPLVSSVNVACGVHAGDPLTIQRTVAKAVAHGIAIGAHPGYPDLIGFGRRDLDMAADELEASIVYQVGAVAAFARAMGTELRHVKAHGALYNRAARDASPEPSCRPRRPRRPRPLRSPGTATSAPMTARTCPLAPTRSASTAIRRTPPRWLGRCARRSSR